MITNEYGIDVYIVHNSKYSYELIKHICSIINKARYPYDVLKKKKQNLFLNI